MNCVCNKELGVWIMVDFILIFCQMNLKIRYPVF